MRTLLAAMLAVSTLGAPAAVLTAGSAAALSVDCTDTTSPFNRPGGYCTLSDGLGSLSAPVTDTQFDPSLCPGDASIKLPQGERVRVAIVTIEYLVLATILGYCPPDV